MIAILAGAALAASSHGMLEVRVTNGADPLVGCVVRLGPTVADALTDGLGGASFPGLEVGELDVRITCEGRSPWVVPGLRLVADRVTLLTVNTGGGGEPLITVVARSAPVVPEVVVGRETVEAVDVSSTSRSQVLTKQFLNSAPTGRSYQSAVTLAKGVTGGSGGNPNMSGGAYNENTYAAAEQAPAPVRTQPRAGSTDDNADLEGFLGFVAGWTDRPGMGGHWARLDVRDRVWIDVVDPDGRPVVGAEVHVVDRRTGSVALVATTAGDGRVPFYPWLDADGPDADKPFEVRVDGASVDRWSGAADREVVTDRAGGRPDRPPVDLVLVLDTTGSMADELATLQTSLLSVTRRLERELGGVDLRIGLVRYRDRGDLYVTDTLGLTSDLASVDRELRRTSADGGGDRPESLNEALAVAASLDFRPEAAKVALLVADAPPHMNYADDLRYDEGVREALAVGLEVHTVAASGLDDLGSLIFRQIAQFTRGKFVFLEYGHDLVASAADHGVDGRQLEGNDLDQVLYDLVREEIDGYGR